MDAHPDEPADREDTEGDAEASGPDRISLTLALATGLLVAAALWLRFGPGIHAEPIRVGERMPPTRLAELHQPGSRLLLGVEGRVLWVVFMSAGVPQRSEALPRLQAVWDRLGADRRFGMAVAASDSAGVERARVDYEDFRGRLPLYLAGREAHRRFGVRVGGEPWHFLIDPHGRVAAMARGSGEETIDRLARMASGWLESMTPASDFRYSLTLADAPAGR